MRRRVVADAPAKINLHLQVFDKRPDGFHEIVSLFQAVSLFDTLLIQTLSDEGVALFGDFDCSASENTIVRAANAFLLEAGIADGLEIRVDKRIPAGAGLGGGSSDAAAVLKALNLMYGERLSPEVLAALGASIGSDVPFFLKEPCAVVSGRGEIVTPIEGRADYCVVLLFPGFATNTARAYAAVDAARKTKEIGDAKGSSEIPSDSRLHGEYGKNPKLWAFHNDFYDALVSGRPELGEAYGALKDANADFVSLTGSGSAFLGVFRSLDAAERAAGMLNGREGRLGKWSSVVAAPLARMPVPRLQ